jgi:hypothetical protein
MENKIITTLGKTNKSFLRTEFGFKNIIQAKKAYGVDTAEEAYEIMQETHNDIVKQEQIIKLNKIKLQKQEQKKKDLEALKRKVFVYKISDGIGEFKSQLNKRLNGKSVVVDVYDEGDRVKSIRVEIDSNFNNWWEKEGKYIFLYPDDTAIFALYPDGKLYIYEGEEFNPKQFKKITQTFKDADNGKCVFNPIRDWATSKYEYAIEKKNKESKSRYNKVLKGLDELEEKYPNGVYQDNIDEVCNKLQIDISIEKPLCDLKFIVCKSIKKALKHFRYENTRLNHIELNEYVVNDKPNIVSRKDLLKMKQELINNKIHHTFEKDLTNISKIKTLKGVYSISNEMNDCFNQFEIDTGLNNCKIDDIDDAMLSSFVKWGTHYNGTIDFKDVSDYELEKVSHIDMSKAYSKFKMCKFYQGFLGKITDFRLTKTIQGVGLYYIYDLVIPNNNFGKYNDTLKIYQSHNIYASFELKFLESKGCSFKILSGCWGVKSLDFDFNDEMINGKNDDGNSYYALWTGKCDSHYLQKKTWINGDHNMVCMIAEHTTAKIEQYENGEICVKYDKKHNYHLGHITAFITAYQRLNVLEQLDAINYDNVIRVCVDGIYTEKVVSDLKNAFRHKNDIEDKTFGNCQGESFISNLIETGNSSFPCDPILSKGKGKEKPQVCPIGKHIYKACGKEITEYKENIMSWVFGEERKHNNKELHIGAGGNGKTHKNLVDKGLVKVLYVSPSWKLARNKQNEYGCNVSVWARLITDDPEMISIVKRYSNVLLIDEVSMMTEQQKIKIFELYSDMKIIFCGDIGFQLGACEYDVCNKCNKNVKNRYCFKCNSNEITHIIPKEIKISGFDEVIENNINYRCKDSRLLELYKDLRMMIEYARPVYEINDYVIEFFMKHKRIINKETLKNMYKVDDMILVGTNKVKDEYTEIFTHLEKYYCRENNRVYSNGDIIIGEKPDCKCELRHAYTTHSIQGETALNNLFIESSKMFDTRMFYTAISRAKTLDQVFIIG